MQNETLKERLQFVIKNYRKEVIIIGAVMSFVLALIVSIVT